MYRTRSRRERNRRFVGESATRARVSKRTSTTVDFAGDVTVCGPLVCTCGTPVFIFSAIEREFNDMRQTVSLALLSRRVRRAADGLIGFVEWHSVRLWAGGRWMGSANGH